MCVIGRSTFCLMWVITYLIDHAQYDCACNLFNSYIRRKQTDIYFEDFKNPPTHHYLFKHCIIYMDKFLLCLDIFFQNVPVTVKGARRQLSSQLYMERISLVSTMYLSLVRILLVQLYHLNVRCVFCFKTMYFSDI